MSDPVPSREFKRVESAAEAQSLLRDCVKTFASTIVWSKDQTHVLESYLFSIDESKREFVAWQPGDFDGADFGRTLARLGEMQCYFSVSLPTANIFFRATFKEALESGLLFRFPDSVFKVQRRQDLRVQLPWASRAEVGFMNPQAPSQALAKPLLDLSAGGLAFIAEPEEAALFTKGAILRELTFKLRNREILAHAEIRHLFPHVNPAGGGPEKIKVGVAFKGLKAADGQFIAAYVLDESRKLHLRFL